MRTAKSRNGILARSFQRVDAMKRLFGFPAATLFLFVASCGQSGPLYIPGNPSEIRQPPPPAESTAEERAEEDDETEEQP